MKERGEKMEMEQLGKGWENVSLSLDTLQTEDIFDAIKFLLTPELVALFKNAEGEQEKSEILNEEIFNHMNSIAPPGCYFGAHAGDGSDFGFWSIVDHPSDLIGIDWGQKSEQQDVVELAQEEQKAQNVTLINLTPHVINFMNADNQVILTLPAASNTARCSVKREVADTISCDGHSIPINKNVFGEVYNLPATQDNTYYIVSSLTAQAVPSRKDVLVPDDVVRDENRNIIGCRALATLGQNK